MRYTINRRAQGILVSLDQEKAFDIIEHEYIFRVLNAFGFPQDFVNLIKELYNNLESTLFLDFRESSPFRVTRGVRQGCPLSPVLFVLSLEPYLRAIADNPQIRGLALPGSSDVKVTAYADDITLYVQNEQSLQHALHTFQAYGTISGAKLNYSKSKYFFIGDPNGRVQITSALQWSPNMKILGITFDPFGMSEDIWAPIVEAFRSNVKAAKEFDFPLLERRYLIQSVFLGNFWYICHTAKPPLRISRTVQSLANSFFWAGGTELLSRPALAQPRDQGGFAFPNVAVTASLLSLRTLMRTLSSDETPAQILARYFLGTSLRVLMPMSPANHGPQSSEIPTMYRAILACHRRLAATCPDADVTTDKVVDMMAAIMEPLVPQHSRHKAHQQQQWKRIAAATLPGHLRDFAWKLGWEILPTRDRLERWGLVRVSTCPNCRLTETNRHVTLGCVVARVFWRAVHAGFRGQGVREFVSRGRFPRGRFAALLVVAGLFSLWRSRCEAVAGNCRRRAIWPILGRMRREILAFLSEELFFLGEREFLRHWSCPFVSAEKQRVHLLFRPTWC